MSAQSNATTHDSPENKIVASLDRLTNEVSSFRQEQSEQTNELKALRIMLFADRRFYNFKDLASISDGNLRAMRASLPEFFSPEQLVEAKDMSPDQLAEIWQMQRILEYGYFSFMQQEVMEDTTLARVYPKSLTQIRFDLWFEELSISPVFQLVVLRQLRYYGSYYGSYADFVNGIMYRFATRLHRTLRSEEKTFSEDTASETRELHQQKTKEATDMLLTAVNQTAENLHIRHSTSAGDLDLADDHGQKLKAFLDELAEEIPTQRQEFIDLLASQPENEFWLNYFEVGGGIRD